VTLRATNTVRKSCLALLATFVPWAALYCQENSPDKPIRVKVVVMAAFERGEDTGDAPGEFQLWVEREHLDQVLSLPSGASE